MGRFANSWALVKASGRVIRQDKELLVLPVLSGLASLLIMAGVFGLAWTNGIFPHFTDAQDRLQPLAIALGLVLYFGLAFVNVYFGAALVAGAHERLAGGDPTLGSCLRAANRRLGRLLVWAAITATVSVVLQVLRERGGFAGRIVAGLGSMAWGIATYFVIPVLLFEDVKVQSSIGRAGGLFKQTWGETAIGNIGVGLIFFLAMVPVALLVFLAIASGSTAVMIPVIVVAVVAGVFISILQTAFNGVHKAALYRFATTGQVPGGFAPEQVQGAFVAR